MPIYILSPSSRLNMEMGGLAGLFQKLHCAGLLTGRFPVRTGVYSHISQFRHKQHLHHDELTIAGILKEAGYSTAFMGKWHLGNFKQYEHMPTPNNHGFDYWFATHTNASPSHFNPDNFVRNGSAVGAINGYSSQIVVDEAIGWLDHHWDKSGPFFLNLWFHEPHKSGFGGETPAPPELMQRHSDTTLPAYYASIENLDQAIGRFLDKLNTMNIVENTLVIFSSDNGSYMIEEGSNGHLKGGKSMLWEGGIRVPGVISWPKVISSARVEETPVEMVDILPTIMDITGTAMPENRAIDGVSFLPLLFEKKIIREKPLYWFYSPSRPVCVVREGDWILISDPEIDIPEINRFEESWIGMVKETELRSFRLFNIKRDPRQQHDVILDYPQIAKKLKKKMLELHYEVIFEARDWRYFRWPHSE